MGQPDTFLVNSRALWVGAAWAGVLVPLSCLRTLDALRITNQIAIGCVGVVVCLVVAYALPAPLDRCAGVAREPCFGRAWPRAVEPWTHHPVYFCRVSL